jgi:hypothetical protein
MPSIEDLKMDEQEVDEKKSEEEDNQEASLSISKPKRKHKPT